MTSSQSSGSKLFRSMSGFTGVTSVSLLLTSALSFFVNSQVTTLEKQFGLSSSQSGILMSSNDIGFLAVGLFISYAVPYIHIPRFLAVCTAVYGLASILCSAPHFLFGTRLDSAEQNLSRNTAAFNQTLVVMDALENTTFCGAFGGKDCKDTDLHIDPSRSNSIPSLIIIAVGMVIQGMSKAPRRPCLVTFVDDSVHKSQSGYYLGILMTASILGPTLAFAVGSLLSRVYVTLENVSFTPRNPKWIGAWWLGYICFGFAAILSALPLLWFPRHLRQGRESVEITDKSKMMATGNPNLEPGNQRVGFFRLICGIFSTPVYIFLLLSTGGTIFSHAGLQAFLPKYLETQFSLEAWTSNLIMAVVSLVTCTVGTYVGGWLTKRFKMGLLLALKWSTVLYCVTLVLSGLGFLFGCQQPRVQEAPRLELCPINCSCDDQQFFPVCGSDQRNYYSPCHAGCTSDSSGTLRNCTCIAGGGDGVPGLCNYGCWYIYPFLLATGTSLLMSAVADMPKLIAEIRSVKDVEKSLSVGFMTSMASVGWMLSPIIFGKAIDSSCLIWELSCTDKAGACALHNIEDFRFKLHALVLGGRTASFLFVALALILAIRRRKQPQTQSSDVGNQVISDL